MSEWNRTRDSDPNPEAVVTTAREPVETLYFVFIIIIIFFLDYLREMFSVNQQAVDIWIQFNLHSYISYRDFFKCTLLLLFDHKLRSWCPLKTALAVGHHGRRNQVPPPPDPTENRELSQILPFQAFSISERSQLSIKPPPPLP